MRSFADYRKNELRRDLNRLNVKEGFNRHFDILRYDLLDAVKLPELVFENVAHNVAYDKLRREDYLYTCRYVEDLTRLCKDQFFDTLMNEVAATAPAPTLDSLKAELVAELKRMIDDLKAKITAMLSATPPTGGSGAASADPEDHIEGDADDPAAASVAASASRGSAPSRAPVSGGGSRGSSVPASASDDGFDVEDDDTGSSPVPSGGGRRGGSSPAPTHGGSAPVYKDFGKTPWDQPTTPFAGKRDLAKPRPDGSHPAPYGNIIPSDGIWNGLKRLGKAYIQRPLGWLTRGIRRAWHGDDTRHMRKESLNPMEQLLLENAQQVLDMIDDFHQKLLAYIDQQIVKIAGIVGGSAGASAASSSVPAASLPGAPKKTGGVGGGTSSLGGAGGSSVTNPLAPAGGPAAAGGEGDHVPVSGRGDSDPAIAAEKGAAVAAGKITPPTDAEPSPHEESATELRDSAAALKGAQALGIAITGIGPGGGWGKVDPTNITAGGGPLGAKWVEIRNRIYDMLWGKMNESEDGKAMIQACRDNKRSTPHPKMAGKMMKGTITKGDQKTLVAQWINAQPKGTRSAIITLLAGYYRKSKGIPTLASGGGSRVTSPPGDGGGPDAGAGVANPSDAALTGDGAGAADKLTGDTVPVSGRPDAGSTAAPATAEGLMAHIKKTDPVLYKAVVEDVGDEAAALTYLGKAVAKYPKLEDAYAAVKKVFADETTAPAPPVDAGRSVPPVSGGTTAAPPVDAGRSVPGAAASTEDPKVKFRAALTKEMGDPANDSFKDLLDPELLDDGELDALIAGQNLDDPKTLATLLGKYVDAVADKHLGNEEAPPAVDAGGGGGNSATTSPVEDDNAPAPDPSTVGASGGTGPVANGPDAPTGDPVAAAKTKAKKLVGKDALFSDPRHKPLADALYDKLKAEMPKGSNRLHAQLLDQADAIADKDGVDAALAFLKQKVDEPTAAPPVAAPPVDSDAGQPTAAPSGGELERGEPVDPKELQIEKQVDQIMRDFSDRYDLSHPNSPTDELDSIMAKILDQYQKVSASKGPEAGLARVKELIADELGHVAPEAPEDKQKVVDPVTSDPVAPPVVKQGQPLPKPPLPAGASKPSQNQKVTKGQQAIKELEADPAFVQLVDRLQNVDALEPILAKVRKGQLKPKTAIAQIGKLVAAEEEAAAGGGDEPDYSRGYYGGDDPVDDGDDPRQYRRSGKKKKRKGRGRNRDANDELADELRGNISDDDDGEGDRDEIERMRPESFGSILNRFRQLLAG